jgi:hypothetical protein
MKAPAAARGAGSAAFVAVRTSAGFYPGGHCYKLSGFLVGGLPGSGIIRQFFPARWGGRSSGPGAGHFSVLTGAEMRPVGRWRHRLDREVQAEGCHEEGGGDGEGCPFAKVFHDAPPFD